MKSQKAADSFAAFHEANPEIYTKLVGMTQQLRDLGHHRVAMNLLIGTLRWNHMIGTNRTDRFKINQNHCGFYARKIGSDYPHLSTMFEYRHGSSVGDGAAA